MKATVLSGQQSSKKCIHVSSTCACKAPQIKGELRRAALIDKLVWVAPKSNLQARYWSRGTLHLKFIVELASRGSDIFLGGNPVVA
jgi:hypothetical protein